MRWPWSRDTKPIEVAETAVCQAERSLKDAQNFQARVDVVSADLTETLRRNHFGAAVGMAMRGTP